MGDLMQRLLYPLQLSFVIVAINWEGKVDVAGDVYDWMGYGLLIEALLGYSQAIRE